MTANDAGETHFFSTSRAADGSFVAISEIGRILAGRKYRLIGGVAVVIHQHLSGLDRPIRATADIDVGVPPVGLKDDSLVANIEAAGYHKIAGNRWARQIDDERRAVVDLLVPAYQTRRRQDVVHGSTSTTEVGGLAEALKRPSVHVVGTVTTTDGAVRDIDVKVPDLASLLGLKLHARRVREEDRDAVDLWTCAELLVAAGEEAEFAVADFEDVHDLLAAELAPDGPSTRILVSGVTDAEAARRRTRLAALVRALLDT